MKRHLLTLLFFFLLLDSSLSIPVETTIGKAVVGFGKAFKNIAKPNRGDEDAEKVTQDALGNAQDPTFKYVQGRIDSQPQLGASQFHCGGFHHRASWPEGRNWFSNRTSLTYRFDPNIRDTFAQVFRDSFRRWSQELSLTLTEKRYDEYDYADITIIKFYNFNDKMVVGDSLIELIRPSNFGAAVGYIRLDANKNWGVLNRATQGDNGMIDIGTVVMHQIGHLLGLSHSSHIDSVMNPYISPGKQRKVFSIGDKQQIKQVYSPNGVGSSP